MKKFLMTATIVMVLVMAMSVMAFAAGAPTISVDKTNANPGDTVIFTVTTNNEAIQATSLNVVGLTFVSATTDGGAANANAFATTGTTVTYTYTVNADAAVGSTYSFTIVAANGSNGTPIVTSNYTNIASTGTVGEAAVTPTPTPTPTAPGTTPTPTATPGQDNVPKTADSTTGTWMLALLGLVALGGVGLFAAKKVFSR